MREALAPPMMGKRSIGPLLGACYAAVFSTLIMAGILDRWPDMGVGVLLLFWSALFVAFYIAGRWLAVRTEQNKKLPTNS